MNFTPKQQAEMVTLRPGLLANLYVKCAKSEENCTKVQKKMTKEPNIILKENFSDKNDDIVSLEILTVKITFIYCATYLLCNKMSECTRGVNFLKIALNFSAQHPTSCLLFLVKKLSARISFNFSPEKAVKMLGVGRNSWAQFLRNQPLGWPALLKTIPLSY